MTTLKDMEYLIGEWHGNGTVMGQDFTQVDRYEWTLGGTFIRCLSEITTPTGKMHMETIAAENRDGGNLAFFFFSGDGSYGTATATIEDKVLTNEGKMVGGYDSRWRSTHTLVDPDTIEFAYEAQKEGAWEKTLTTRFERKK